MGRSRQRGWVLIDAIAGLVLVSLSAGVLAVGLNRIGRARERIEGRTVAVERLEAVLAGGELAGPDVRVEELGDGWVKVSSGRAEVIGKRRGGRAGP